MRFSHWLKTVASALLLSAAAGPALAQGPGGPGYGQTTFQPAYGSNDPGVLYPQGVPQGYQPYPAISPYGMGNVAWDQTFRDDNGLWFERMLHTNREFFGSLDVTSNTIKKPGSRELGSAHIPFDPATGGLLGYTIPTYGQGATPTSAGFPILGSGVFGGQVVLDPRVIPYPIGGSAPFFFLNQINKDVFPIRGLSEFGNYKSAGLQGRWGFLNEDGSGLAIQGFWTGQDQQSFTMGQDSINGIPITKAIIAANPNLLFTRNGAIPLDWGFRFTDPAQGITGNLGTAKYDLLFHMDTQTSVAGGDVNFYLPLVMQREGLKVRPMIGGRYMMIDDQFNFRGIDSGFDYNILLGILIPNTYRPAGGVTDIYELVDARLSSSVQTQLAGPQVGLRYDLGGGEKFKLWGQTQVGLMGNREQYRLSGNNIGDQASLLLFGNGVDMLASDARFQSTRTVSHVSPLFEQTITAEMRILEMIPVVRKLPWIDNTVFRVGYTATVVGDVARSGDSIDWRGFPRFPSIKPNRDTWWMSRWNFGIEKRF